MRDLKNWRKKALKAGGWVEFTSEVIPAAAMEYLNRHLGATNDPDEIAAIFDEASKAVRIVPEGAEDTLPDIPGEVAWSDADHERADALWDRLMPEYRGMLDADVTGKTDYDLEQY